MSEDTHRFNWRTLDDGRREFCRGLHDKSAPCEWEAEPGASGAGGAATPQDIGKALAREAAERVRDDDGATEALYQAAQKLSPAGAGEVTPQECRPVLTMGVCARGTAGCNVIHPEERGTKLGEHARPEAGPMQDAESLSGVQALGSSGSPTSPAGAGEAERLAAAHDYTGDPKHCHVCALTAFARECVRARRVEQALAEKDAALGRYAAMRAEDEQLVIRAHERAEQADAALGRVQALVEQWRAHAAQLTRDRRYECLPENILNQCLSELAAALRGEVQP